MTDTREVAIPGTRASVPVLNWPPNPSCKATRDDGCMALGGKQVSLTEHLEYLPPLQSKQDYRGMELYHDGLLFLHYSWEQNDEHE